MDAPPTPAPVAPDPHDLQRFVVAQAPLWSTVRAELAAGRKRSHWMWFVFPQLRGLGTSATARQYGIASLDEARAYLAHPLLGARLREAAALLLALPQADPVAVFGPVDAMKLRSSATLFALAAPAEPLFTRLLDNFFAGAVCAATMQRLRT